MINEAEPDGYTLSIVVKGRQQPYVYGVGSKEDAANILRKFKEPDMIGTARQITSVHFTLSWNAPKED